MVKRVKYCIFIGNFVEQFTGSPYYRLLEKYFVQEIIFRSFTYHCVVLLSSFHLHSQPIRVILREIKILKGAHAPLFPYAPFKIFISRRITQIGRECKRKDERRTTQ